jgi:hypothetical protein
MRPTPVHGAFPERENSMRNTPYVRGDEVVVTNDGAAGFRFGEVLKVLKCNIGTAVITVSVKSKEGIKASIDAIHVHANERDIFDVRVASTGELIAQFSDAFSASAFRKMYTSKHSIDVIADLHKHGAPDSEYIRGLRN